MEQKIANDRFLALSRICLNNWHYITKRTLSFNDEINFFTGHSGSGKSTVGAALAALTGREAIDIDARIAEKAGCSIPEIFAKGGEAAFRALEREATAACGALSGKLLLTGGGVVKTPENYAALHQNGRIYQLLRPLELLPTDGRPLSQGADLAAMWAERAPLYERFRDAAIDNSGTVEQTAQAIWRDFCEHSGD